MRDYILVLLITAFSSQLYSQTNTNEKEIRDSTRAKKVENYLSITLYPEYIGQLNMNERQELFLNIDTISYDWYEKLEEEAELTYLNLKERITAKEERLAKTAERLANTKQLLSILAKRISAVDEKALDNNDAKVVERWQKILNRPLTATEKGIIHLLVRERGSGLWCLNNAIYSPSLCMVPGPGIDGVRNETNERIINDLNTVLKGERIVYEQRLHSISTALNKRVI